MSAATQIPPPSPLETARRHHAENRLLEAAKAYRQTLESDPQSQSALLGLSLIARQSNQLEPALRMAQAALAVNPNHALAWANCGDLLLAARNFPKAKSAYRRALALDTTLAVAHYGLANIHALAEDYPAALPHFARATQLNPAIPEFHFAHGFALGKLGEHPKAIAAYRRAVQLRSNFASAWLNLGVELIADGRDQLAELCYAQALTCTANPDTQISTHLNHGHLLRSRKSFPAAQTRYQSALTLATEKSPNRRAEAHVAFTYLHLEQQQFELAHQSLKNAESAQLTHKPNPEIPNVRGILLLAQHTANDPLVLPNQRTEGPETERGFVTGHDFSRADKASHIDGALAPEPSHLISQAIEAFLEAERQGHKTAPSNRGNALLRLGHVEEALQAHQEALRRDPHHPGVRYNLALTQLRAGNFHEGWQNYEIRWQFREVHPHPRRFSQPRWQGQPLPANARLFVYAEQGLGDTLQFLRYLQLLPPMQILLEVQPPLTRLIAQSVAQWPQLRHPLKCACHPEQSFCPAGRSIRHERRICHPERSEGSAVPHSIHVLTHGEPIPPFTHHIPLMSLPALFHTTQETIPTPIPYLFSPPIQEDGSAPSSTPHLGQGWDEENPAFDQTFDSELPKIGLHWAGNPNYRADRERSTHLQTFLPLLQIPKIQWISLQKGPAALEITQLPAEAHITDACSQDRDLADTAARIEPLDLILTTDSAVAHLAAAMGKPLWLLLPWQSDWRWMQDRLDTPWYPQARLFRQSSPHNWPELVRRVSAELQAWLFNSGSAALALGPPASKFAPTSMNPSVPPPNHNAM